MSFLCVQKQGTLPIQVFRWPKKCEMEIKKNIHNLSQGPLNPGFMQEKVQKGDFLKKPLRGLNFFVGLGL